MLESLSAYDMVISSSLLALSHCLWSRKGLLGFRPLACSAWRSSESRVPQLLMYGPKKLYKWRRVPWALVHTVLMSVWALTARIHAAALLSLRLLFRLPRWRHGLYADWCGDTGRVNAQRLRMLGGSHGLRLFRFLFWGHFSCFGMRNTRPSFMLLHLLFGPSCWSHPYVRRSLQPTPPPCHPAIGAVLRRDSRPLGWTQRRAPRHCAAHGLPPFACRCRRGWRARPAGWAGQSGRMMIKRCHGDVAAWKHVHWWSVEALSVQWRCNEWKSKRCEQNNATWMRTNQARFSVIVKVWNLFHFVFEYSSSLLSLVSRWSSFKIVFFFGGGLLDSGCAACAHIAGAACQHTAHMTISSVCRQSESDK